MKKLILVAILCSFVSCDEVQIEPNKRIEVTGRLINENSQPVSGIEVVAAGTRNQYLDNNEDKLLGKTTTEADGSFNFISLDSYSHNLIFSINPMELDHSPDVESIYILEISGNHEMFYDFGDYQLGKRIEFEIRIKNTSGTQDTLRYKFEYQNPVRYFTYENGNFAEESDNSNQVYLREQVPGDAEFVRELAVLGGTDIKFIYSLGENPPQEITIPVNPENTSYEFEY